MHRRLFPWLIVLAGCGATLEISLPDGGGLRADGGATGGGSAGGSSAAGGVAAAGGSARAGGAAGGAVSAGGASGGGTVAAGGVAAGGAAGGGGAGGAAGGGTPGCSASTCATGCCLNGTCQPGTQPLACGTGGVTCVQCMNGDVCTAQACGVDPTSMWRVRPVSAVIAAMNGSSNWDTFGGLPDVFVTMYCPANASSGTDTPTVDNTLTPSWSSGGCTASAQALLSTGFAWEAFDHDGVLNPNDTITSKTTVTLSVMDLASTPMTLMRGPVGATQSIVFELTRM